MFPTIHIRIKFAINYSLSNFNILFGQGILIQFMIININLFCTIKMHSMVSFHHILLLKTVYFIFNIVLCNSLIVLCRHNIQFLFVLYYLTLLPVIFLLIMTVTMMLMIAIIGMIMIISLLSLVVLLLKVFLLYIYLVLRFLLVPLFG